MTAELQHTLAKSAGFSGTSLHTGEKVTLKLQPAPVDHGIKFKRKDLADEPTIDANIANLKTAAQEAPRRFFDVREPIHVESKSGSLLVLLPDDKFRVSCTQAGPNNRFTQFFSAEISPALYEREIAPARTFVYYEEVAPLMEKNLIKGGSLENAIVVRGDAVLSKEPLRFADEFARHKILDIIGDIALIGTRIRGHIIAVKPGHAVNAELARAIVKQHAKITALSVPRTFPPGEGGLDINQVMEILPHRFPFLMVDRILGFEGETKCTGLKTVTVNEPYFAGHFPGHPVMPGVLQVEAMAQVASILLMKLAKSSSRIGYFMSADEVKFRKPVFPGDTLFIHAELIKARSNRLAKARCSCVVNDAVVSEGDLMFTFLDK